MAAKIEPLLTIADLDACPEDNNRYELDTPLLPGFKLAVNTTFNL